MPTAMRDRWRHRAEPVVGSGTVYWHVLMRDHEEVLAAADEAQARLGRFTGLHLTPRRWFHMTVYVAGSTNEIGPDSQHDLLHRAQEAVAAVPAVRVTTSRILYHPEAIMLGMEPIEALRAVAELIRAATDSVVKTTTPHTSDRISSWIPHVTVAYSTAEQAVQPIAEALGASVHPRGSLVERIALVNQWGPERDWNWEVVGDVALGRNESSP